MNEFDGRVLLLTGATGGIGRAIAELFFSKGAGVALADLDERMCDEVRDGFAQWRERWHGEVISIRYNASVPEDAETAVQRCLQQLGRIDFLIPAAGILEEHAFAHMTDEQWRKTMSINLDGVFYICRRAVPNMSENGSVVVIASDAGHQGATPGHAHYGASKAGVLGLAKSMARELAPRLRVNAISPGAIDTPMIANFMRSKGAATLSSTPMKRLGTPAEVAAAAAFLCGSGATFITGQTLHPNGGYYMGG